MDGLGSLVFVEREGVSGWAWVSGVCGEGRGEWMGLGLWCLWRGKVGR